MRTTHSGAPLESEYPRRGFTPGGTRGGAGKLTPVECERLQGLPDNWTHPPGIRSPDTRRYAAVGDAVTVPVAEWLGRRIAAEYDRDPMGDDTMHTSATR